MCFEKFNKTGQILHSTLQFLSGGLIKYHQFHYTVFSENLLKTLENQKHKKMMDAKQICVASRQNR